MPDFSNYLVRLNPPSASFALIFLHFCDIHILEANQQPVDVQTPIFFSNYTRVNTVRHNRKKDLMRLLPFHHDLNNNVVMSVLG